MSKHTTTIWQMHVTEKLLKGSKDTYMTRSVSRCAFICAIILSLTGALNGQPERKQKKPGKNDQKEPVTQTLPVLPDPPPAVAAETARLVFHVSPLSAKGLLSQQVRDALRALERDNRGAQMVKLRAFVAGTGDMRRVQQIVSEVFTEKKQPLPALTTIEVGALPLEGAQVVIESVSADKRMVNPSGLAFLPVQPIAGLKAGGEILKVTCFLTAFDVLEQARTQIREAFPAAAADFVQLTRFGGQPMTECDAVAHVGAAPPSGAVVFSGPKIVFTGLQMAFSDQDADIRLALDRLKRAVEPLGGRMDGSLVSAYTLTREGAGAVGRVLGAGASPLIIEELPSLDAAVGLEAVAAGN